MKFLNKKGDLNLSINAIVVLIIAIVFLGLALTFTRNIIMGSSDKLLSGVGQVDLQNPASSEKPITFDGSWELGAGDQKTMKVSIYSSTSISSAAPASDLVCANLLPAGKKISISSLPTTLNSNTPTGYVIRVKADSGITADTYLCKFQVCEGTVSGTVVTPPTSCTTGTIISTQIPVKITG